MNFLLKIFLICFSIFIFGCEQKEYVKDFKVEGISVGDSLLTYFSEEHVLEFQNMFLDALRCTNNMTYSVSANT